MGSLPVSIQLRLLAVICIFCVINIHITIRFLYSSRGLVHSVMINKDENFYLSVLPNFNHFLSSRVILSIKEQHYETNQKKRFIRTSKCIVTQLTKRYKLAFLYFISSYLWHFMEQLKIVYKFNHFCVLQWNYLPHQLCLTKI